MGIFIVFQPGISDVNILICDICDFSEHLIKKSAPPVYYRIDVYSYEPQISMKYK